MAVFRGAKSSKTSQKCALHHNGKLFIVILIGHSVKVKEEYGYIKTVLDLLKYDEQNLIICID